MYNSLSCFWSIYIYQGCRFAFDIGGDINQPPPPNFFFFFILSSFTHPDLLTGKQSSSGSQYFFFLLWKSMVPQNSLVTFFKISSFVFSRTKKFIQVWNYLRVSKWWQNFHFFWVNYPFIHTSLYFNMNWIGPRMILKEYSAVAVVTKRIWWTDKLHALISVLFFILWIFQLTVWIVHSVEQH